MAAYLSTTHDIPDATTKLLLAARAPQHWPSRRGTIGGPSTAEHLVAGTRMHARGTRAR